MLSVLAAAPYCSFLFVLVLIRDFFLSGLLLLQEHYLAEAAS